MWSFKWAKILNYEVDSVNTFLYVFLNVVVFQWDNLLLFLHHPNELGYTAKKCHPPVLSKTLLVLSIWDQMKFIPNP